MNFQQKIPNQIAFLIVIIFGLIVAIFTSYIGSGLVADISNSKVNVTSIDELLAE